MSFLRCAFVVAALAVAGAYDNGAPNARLPTLGWSSWVALGPPGSDPIFDYCDEFSLKATVDAFVALGFPSHGYRCVCLASFGCPPVLSD